MEQLKDCADISTNFAKICGSVILTFCVFKVLSLTFLEVGVSKMIRPDTSGLLRAASQQPTPLMFKDWGLWASVELWGTVLPGGRPGRALREKTPVAAVGGGRLIIAGLSSGRTCSTGVRAWASTVES